MVLKEYAFKRRNESLVQGLGNIERTLLGVSA
jgi:hypothetical protein